MQNLDIQPNSNPTALKIIDAAAQLFMQRGYTAVSLSDIIRAAGVTKPTLYYYFADKEDLFLHTGLRVLAQIGDAMDEALATPGDVAVRLRALAEEMLRDRDRDMRMMRHEMFEHLGPTPRMRLAHAFHRRLFVPVVRLMAEGLDAGELAGHPAEVLATMFLGIAEAFLEFADSARAGAWAAGRSAPSPGRTLNAGHLVDMFLYGVAGPAARRQ